MTVEALLTVLQRALDAAASTVASHFTAPANSRAYGCSVSACDRPAYASGLCNGHYIRKRQGKVLDEPFRVRKRDDRCSECGKATGAKGGWGMCPSHYKQRRQRALKSALVEHLGGKCTACNGAFPLAVYDFHHVGGKDASPGYLIANGSLESIAAEISKCVLLCANCHRTEHYE